MMNLTPYTRRDGNIFKFMDDLERSFFNDSVSGIAQFRCDITEKDGNYMLAAELPGFNPEDIQVEVDGDTLTISAQHTSQNDEKDKEGNYIRRERRYGSFSRSFDVSGIDIDNITADYSNGVLELKMPSMPEAKPENRKINIQGKAESGKKPVEAKQPEAKQADDKQAQQQKGTKVGQQAEQGVPTGKQDGGDVSTAPEEDGCASSGNC